MMPSSRKREPLARENSPSRKKARVASSLHDLQSQIRQQGVQSQVQVNQRALIDKMLARYAGHLSTFRELTQNADDAGATELRLQVRGEWDAQEARAVALQDIVVSNNGRLFTDKDWQRVSKIAEGNPDEQTVGMFGVGFYSVFALTEEPVIGSGGEWMAFYWNEDQLCFGRMQGGLTDERLNATCQKETVFLFPVRDEEMALSLSELVPFFQSTLYFSRHIQSIRVLVNDEQVLSLHKEVANRPMTLPQDKSLQLPAKIIQSLQPSLVSSKVATTCSKLRFQSQSSHATAFTIHTCYPQQAPSLQEYLLARATFTTHAETSFHADCQRILKKNLPAQITSSLLLQVDGDAVGTGKLYVGISTHQRTGCLAHMAGHFYPTMERENIDFRDPALGQWNALVLFGLGRLSSHLYHALLSSIGKPAPWRGANAEISEDTLAYRLARVFALGSTAPQELIQETLVSGFYTNDRGPLLLTQHGVMPSEKVYWCARRMNAFFASLGLVVPSPVYYQDPLPQEFFHHLQTRTLMKTLESHVLLQALPSRVISTDDLIALLTWLLEEQSTPFTSEQLKSILRKVTFCESELVTEKKFSKITRYAAPTLGSLPVPLQCLPDSVCQFFSSDALHKRLRLTVYQPKDWVLDLNRSGQSNILRQYAEHPLYAPHILAFFSTFKLGKGKHKALVKGLSSLSCIPTQHGMQPPSTTALPCSLQGQPSPSVHLVDLLLAEEGEEQAQAEPEGVEMMDLSEDLPPRVSVSFLRELGVRVAPPASVVVENLMTMASESHERVVQNLYEHRMTFTDTDWDHIRQVPFFRCLRGVGSSSSSETRQCAAKCYVDLALAMGEKEISTEQQAIWQAWVKPHWIIQWRSAPSPAIIKFLASHLHIHALPPLPQLFDPLCGREIRPAGMNEYRQRFQMLMAFWTSHYKSQFGKDSPTRQYRFVLSAKCVCLAVDEVFLESTPFGPPVHSLVSELAAQYHVPLKQLGLQAQPTVTYILERLKSETKDTIHAQNAAECLECLSGIKFSTAEMKALKALAFVPCGQGRYKKPGDVFLHSQDATEEQCPELFAYQSFTPLADEFLVACGAKHHPSARDWVQVFVEGTACRDYFHSDQYKQERYLEILRQLGGHVQSLPATWTKKLAACTTLLGIDKKSEEQGLYAAKDCYLLDNSVWATLLQPVLAPSGDAALTQLYSALGASWLTACVQEKAKPVGNQRQSEQTQRLQELIHTRYPLFLRTKAGLELESIRANAATRLKHLVVREFEEIHRTLHFQGRQVQLPHGEEISMCTVYKGKTLALHQGSELNYFDIGIELSRLVTADESLMEERGTLIAQQLQTPLSSLRARGFAIDRILGVDAIQLEQHKRASRSHPEPMHVEDEGSSHTTHAPGEVVEIEDFYSNAQSAVSSLESVVKASRSRKGKTIKSSTQNQQAHTEEQADDDCAMEFDVELDASLKNKGVELYRTPDAQQALSSEWTKAYRQFHDLLQVITQCIPQLKREACKIFLDERGTKIAFNYNCTLFFNLRYYYQCHYQPRVEYGKTLFFWFVSTCHELAHNREFSHNKEHGRLMEELIAHYGTQVLSHISRSQEQREASTRPPSRTPSSSSDCVDLT